MQQKYGLWNVLGVDISPTMVEAARAAGVEARVGDALEHGFKDAVGTNWDVIFTGTRSCRVSWLGCVKKSAGGGAERRGVELNW